MTRGHRDTLGWLATLALAGCTAGPDYHRPVAPDTPAFKEAAGWTPSRPADAIDKGAWWTMYGDVTLDALEARVATGNQTVAQYEAAYRQARETIAKARAAQFPTIGADIGATASRTPAGVTATATGTDSAIQRTNYIGELEASWVPDLWGKVRRTIEGDRALAEASAADLANARLAAQAMLAQDYFALRSLDAQAALWRETIAAYQRFLTITTNQYRQGMQARAAVLSAQTQLEGAQASLVDTAVQRSAMEHAIAVLVGVPPAALTIAPAPMPRAVPVVPAGIPSTLLQRRPDIAAAERRMAAANAQIGVATAAYFPDLTLSGGYGTGASRIGELFAAGSSLWSLGANLVGTIFDFGARRATVRGARAAYDEAVASYRQTVLTAFQGVEDQLSALHHYGIEQDILARKERAATEAARLALDQYKAGTVDYTTVVVAQATEISARQASVTMLQQRLQASALLAEDVGGGWSIEDPLPK